jgi:hypothetical protein
LYNANARIEYFMHRSQAARSRYAHGQTAETTQKDPSTSLILGLVDLYLYGEIQCYYSA